MFKLHQKNVCFARPSSGSSSSGFGCLFYSGPGCIMTCRLLPPLPCMLDSIITRAMLFEIFNMIGPVARFVPPPPSPTQLQFLCMHSIRISRDTHINEQVELVACQLKVIASFGSQHKGLVRHFLTLSTCLKLIS